MPRGMTEAQRFLRDEVVDARETMSKILAKVEGRSDRKFTPAERAEFDKADNKANYAMSQIKLTLSQDRSEYADVRGPAQGGRQGMASAEIQGTPGEQLSPRHSMVEYVRRAAANGVSTQPQAGGAARKVEYQDNDYLNAYWGQRMGLASHESRALAQDTAGSGQAITPQAWTAQVVDFLYADSVVGQLGVTKVAMPTELYNVPVFTAPVAPAWLAENATIGLDANPAFSTLQLNAKGGWKDITTYSVELAHDAYISGSLPAYLAQSCARNMALAVDAAAIVGVAGNAGNPGINSETGFVFRHYTGDAGTTGATIASTAELSVINEVSRNANAHVSAYLSNVKVEGTFARSTSGSFPMYWPRPADVTDIPWVTTANANILPATETDPATASAVAQSGGTMSSIYAGPWSFMILGIHLDLQTFPLVERYRDLGQIGLWSFMRASIRTANPQAFSRTIGMLTT